MAKKTKKTRKLKRSKKVSKRVSKKASKRAVKKVSKKAVKNVARKSKTRTERDYLGKVKVPKEAYYGGQTQRAVKNFPISGIRFPNEFIRSYAIIKKAAAITNTKVGNLNKYKSKAIQKACDEIIAGKMLDQFVVDVFQAGAGTSTNMNLNEVIANRAIVIMRGIKGDYGIVNPYNDVNMSQSTNDSFHSAIHIASLTMIRKDLIPALKRLSAELKKKSKKFSKVMKPGRTHLMNAVSISMGDEFGGYAASIEADIEYIEKALPLMEEINIGGTAVGSGINAPHGYGEKMVEEISRMTRMKFRKAGNYYAATQNTTAEMQVSAALRLTALNLVKISSDIRLMSSGPISGFKEIRLPAVQPGSSIMPAKVNPSIPEMLEMAAYQVMGNDTVISYSTRASQFELNVMMPVIAYNLMSSIEIMAHAVDVFTKKAIVGIKPNTKFLKKMVDRNPFSATKLVPYIGYYNAAQVIKEAVEKERTIREVLIDSRLLDKKTLQKVLKKL